ncbi:MAG: [FeFe] hydrogenase H-cluster maturation GTPase HydF [Proteiniphilum sp.]|uniref:[FeFe] hydrogenase H-cluster maturation GTPase HydF n=1 Tax=Proteiniphilum sp. TaxID=1926877 RepID=UPI002B1EF57B|nr:[FeFe] hydrogenase H-cluster maturation GTPase HydF [Proteiniphilum sp.]MEA5129124.1 [FeFe] hydrogenase H-cluster maturation GTPase HydF [Proteiniphilum sp.]
MSINSLHIGIFGRRNTGKSSLINMLTGQDISIVSNFPGTTTDPVKKSVEIFDIGPAILIDTAGIDDLGEIGNKKIQKSQEVIMKVDCAILLIAGNQFGDYEMQLIEQFKKNDVPYLLAHNKNDIDKIAAITISAIQQHSNAEIIDFSTINPADKERLISALKRIVPSTAFQKSSLIGDLVQPKDVVLLITPIDSEAPEGRMILPQNQTIRDALDNRCITVVVRENEIADFLALGVRPALAITDSSAFGIVAEVLPEDIPLTSFSILFARMKGNFSAFLEGTPHISRLSDGDRILLLESCTHQTSCDDIGRVKIPNLLQQFTGKELNFTVVSGLSELPPKIRDFSLVIQCGGCMVTRKQLINRLRPFIDRGIPVTNYGMVLAYIHGIFRRATKMLERKPVNLSLFPDD